MGVHPLIRVVSCCGLSSSQARNEQGTYAQGVFVENCVWPEKTLKENFHRSDTGGN